MFRLKSIYIKEYKNIKDQTFDFSANTGYIALIGLNGSGKSNLIEAISIIVKGLYNHREIPFDYEIKYEVDSVLYERKKRIAKKNGKKVSDSEMQYPSSLIACYSGEDMRLWHNAYEEYYMHYFSQAVRSRTFSPRIMYINKYAWKIAFIALLCSSNEKVKSFLQDCLKIDDITKVNIHFESDADKRAIFTSHAACRWYDSVKNLQDEDEHKVINANVLATIDMTTYGAPSQEACKYVFQFLYLLSLPEKNADHGQTIDKLITDIKITIGDVDFDNLSEGEKKMILVECITCLLADENSLVLLDEPDAHVHVANKKKILETIEEFKGQTILTTHSPIFTTLMKNGNIYPVANGKSISEKQRDLIIKMANNNISYIDGACIITSKYLVVTEGPGDVNYIKAAIRACGNEDAQYKVLEQVSFVYTGGANLVKEFYDEILSNLYDTLAKIVFVFDLDSDGREGAKQAQDLIIGGKDKIKIIYYHNNYPIADINNTDFYVEDLFPRSAYNIVQLPNIGGEPTYAQLKKGNTLASSIKSKIAEQYKKNLLRDEDYYNFKPFLRQLKLELGL